MAPAEGENMPLRVTSFHHRILLLRPRYFEPLQVLDSNSLGSLGFGRQENYEVGGLKLEFDDNISYGCCR